MFSSVNLKHALQTKTKKFMSDVENKIDAKAIRRQFIERLNKKK